MGNPTPAYLLKRDQEIRDIKNAIAEKEQQEQRMSQDSGTNMKIKNIFNEWASEVTTTYDELMSTDKKFLTDLILSRNLIVIKGIGPDLSDSEFYKLGNKFGRCWTNEDYAKSYVIGGNLANGGKNKALVGMEENTPVSYFKSDNNYWTTSFMNYHADLPHAEENSFPGRVLYMASNVTNGSGDTTWLNLEHGWAQCTDKERARFDGHEIVYHDMYVPQTRFKTVPFLKTNPFTGKQSPAVNCSYWGNKSSLTSHIHHVLVDGKPLSYVDGSLLIRECYALMESKENTMFTHHWENGDMIVYDNWFNVHKREEVILDEVKSRILKRLNFSFE